LTTTVRSPLGSTLPSIRLLISSSVSSLIAQGTEFPLRKPAGFHWDIFLLGLTTGIGGLLGIPFPNGLIPQAPFHTKALCVTSQSPDTDETHKGHTTRVVHHVVEQRLSNLAQGLLTLGTMTGPLLVVLHLIPQGVLAGLFFVMGVEALLENGITKKCLFLLRDHSLTPSATEPLTRIRRKRTIYYFVALELFGFAATFAITQTIAAIGFPIIILLLVPVRTFLLPRYFSPEELSVLDAPTASPFTMESVGGNFGEDASPDGSGETTATATPAEVAGDDTGDVLERGEGDVLGDLGVSGPGQARGPGGVSHRRASFRVADGEDGIELKSGVQTGGVRGKGKGTGKV